MTPRNSLERNVLCTVWGTVWRVLRVPSIYPPFLGGSVWCLTRVSMGPVSKLIDSPPLVLAMRELTRLYLCFCDVVRYAVLLSRSLSQEWVSVLSKTPCACCDLPPCGPHLFVPWHRDKFSFSPQLRYTRVLYVIGDPNTVRFII